MQRTSSASMKSPQRPALTKRLSVINIKEDEFKNKLGKRGIKKNSSIANFMDSLEVDKVRDKQYQLLAKREKK